MPEQDAVWASEDVDEATRRKEILWIVFIEGIIDRKELLRRYNNLENKMGKDIDNLIQAGYIDEIEGYLIIHSSIADELYKLLKL
jgi:hypothetical protein